MRRSCLRLLLPVVVAGLGVALVCGGCGGGNGVAAATGGTVSGTAIDAATGLGLGGVQVAVETAAGVWQTAVSTTPAGAFIVDDVPAGNYTTLRVTPDPVLYGPPRNVDVNMVVVEGANTVLPGPILILDEYPPNPI